jgi:hypothetical protein
MTSLEEGGFWGGVLWGGLWRRDRDSNLGYLAVYTLTLTGTGTVTVSATQGGNTTFNPATTVVRTFTVTL